MTRRTARFILADEFSHGYRQVKEFAEDEPAKFERAALRWHSRSVTEKAPPLLRAQIALAAVGEAARRPLVELGGRVTPNEG